MAKLQLVFGVLTLCSAVFCQSCQNPQITSKSFTTQDATIVTSIAYISEFGLRCTTGSAESLYAELNGHVVPVSRVGSNLYQVSWTEDSKTAKSGNKLVRIFDEEGHAELRKALRAGTDVSSVPSLFDVIVAHSGAYYGPWLKSELIAALFAVVVAYFAVSLKSRESA